MKEKKLSSQKTRFMKVKKSLTEKKGGKLTREPAKLFKIKQMINK
jgi:hypothetical protein